MRPGPRRSKHANRQNHRAGPKDKEEKRKHRRCNEDNATSVVWENWVAATGCCGWAARRVGGERMWCAQSLSQTWWSGNPSAPTANTAGTMENKPTQGKTGLTRRRLREDRRRRGAAKPGATKPRVLILNLGLVLVETESTLACAHEMADHYRRDIS